MERHHFRFLGLIPILGAVSSQRLRFACLLAILGLILAAAPARAELTFFHATTAGLSLSDNPLSAGQPLTLTGSVKDAGGAPVTAGFIEIQVADAPEGPWTVLERGEVDEHGRFHQVDYTLGLETRPLYVRTGYRGHEAGQVRYSASVSPAIPLMVRTDAGQDEAVAVGFVAAVGDGEPGRQGSGPWEFVIVVKALQDVEGVLFQGTTGDWAPLQGATWDFQADTGRVLARLLEGEAGETLITWHLGSLAAGDEATLRVMVDGVIAVPEMESDAVVPLGGAGVASFSIEGDPARQKLRLFQSVSLSPPGAE